MALELASPKQIANILKDINATEKSLNQGVEALGKWLEKQPHLPKALDKNMLKTILVIKKNSVEKSKIHIDNYWSSRNSCSEFYINRDPSDPQAREFFKDVKVYPLPKLTPEGVRVTMMHTVGSDLRVYDPRLIMKRFLSIFDIRRKHEIYFKGDFIVIDCKGFSFGHLTRYSPTLASRATYCSQEIISSRIAGQFFINANHYVDKGLAMFRPFLKKKVAERLHVFTGDHTNLYKFIPQDILPNEYGGKAGTIDELNASWQKRLEAEKDWLISIGAQKTDESKRPPDSPRKSDLFGLEGNFKQLTFD